MRLTIDEHRDDTSSEVSAVTAREGLATIATALGASRPKPMRSALISVPVSEVERERLDLNKKDLSDFFPSPCAHTVPLPEELFNEPYSHNDNGDRPEMKVYRPRFLFETHPRDGYICLIGRRELKREGRDAFWYAKTDEPKKGCCVHSVVNIYDTYGLSIAYAFLQHLYYHKNWKTEWLAGYLRGSLAVLDSGALDTGRESNDVLYLSSLLMLQLTVLDSRQSRTTDETTVAPELPIEILARIINSTRISHRLTAEVMSYRIALIPTIEELDSYAIYPSTVRVGNSWNVTWTTPVSLVAGLWDSEQDENRETLVREWQLVRDGEIFTLRLLEGDDVPDAEQDGYVAQYALDTYEDVCRARDCDGPVAVQTMLRRMSERLAIVSDTNVDEMCAWIVQLSHDTLDGENKVMVGKSELGVELQRLIAIAIEDLENKSDESSDETVEESTEDESE